MATCWYVKSFWNSLCWNRLLAVSHITVVNQQTKLLTKQTAYGAAPANRKNRTPGNIIWMSVQTFINQTQLCVYWIKRNWHYDCHVWCHRRQSRHVTYVLLLSGRGFFTSTLVRFNPALSKPSIPFTKRSCSFSAIIPSSSKGLRLKQAAGSSSLRLASMQRVNSTAAK